VCHRTGGQHVGSGRLHNIAAKAQSFTAIEAIAFILIAIELYGPVLGGSSPDLGAKFRVK